MTLRRNRLNPEHNKQPKKFPPKKPLSYFLKIKRPTGVKLEASKLTIVKHEVKDQTENQPVFFFSFIELLSMLTNLIWHFWDQLTFF